jgi:molybdopterin/thiamine biosynthesis adenylyltransferase
MKILGLDQARGPTTMPARLVLREADMERLRSHLLQEDKKERAAFAFLGIRGRDNLLELYVHRLLLPEDSDYYEQHEMVVEPKPEFVLQTFSQFAQGRVLGFLHTHSHPFCGNASFSSIDNHYFPGMVRSFKHYLLLAGKERNFLFATMVWGQREGGFSAHCFSPAGSVIANIEELNVVGKHGIRVIPTFSVAQKRDNEPIPGQFQRQVEFLGEEGQRLIQKTHLAVCGVGGLGSLVIACAKGLGFREITLIDPDILEESNLNRFQGATKKDIGRPKAAVVAEAVNRFDPSIKVNAIAAAVEEEKARQGLVAADFIINCLDDDGARLEAQIIAALYLKPLLDLGSGIILEKGTRAVREMGGQATLYFPGGACLLCQGLDPTTIIPREIHEVQRAVGYIAGTEETPASVVTLNAVIAGVGLQTTINYLTGFAPAPSYIKYDLLRHETMQLNFTKRPACPICGNEGIEGRGEELLEPPIRRIQSIRLPPAGAIPSQQEESPCPADPEDRCHRSRFTSTVRYFREKAGQIETWLKRRSHATGQG